MKRTTFQTFLTASLFLVSAGQAAAYGRGGGGFHAGGVAVGGYRGGAVGGYHAGAVGGYRAGGVADYHVGGASGFRAGGVADYHVGGVGGYRASAVGVAGRHVGMATDFGFGHVAGVAGARGYVAAGHYTRGYSAGVLAARGAAVRGGFYHYGAFNTAWWAGHPAAWRPYGWNAAYAWRWATWPALAGWFAWSAPPVYYDYGNTIVYQGDQVYVDGQPDATAADYYQQAVDLSQTAPAVLPPPDKRDDEWQPLGVFALVQAEQSDAAAIFQLAVNKAGIVGGNYYNVLTNTTLPVRGAVDKKTQRASWIVGDQKTTVYDTGIYNLTKDESPVLIHFGKDRTQQWLLVRVKENDAKAPPVNTAAEVAPPPTPSSSDAIARVTVIVPADADVFIDGTQMTQTGTVRTFSTPPLEKGYRYSYTIRARWTEDGSPVEQSRTVAVTPGKGVRVDFTSSPP